MELERGDIAIDRDMEVDCDIGQEILAYVETWFDVDKKFGIHTADDDGTWLNMYSILFYRCIQKGRPKAAPKAHYGVCNVAATAFLSKIQAGHCARPVRKDSHLFSYALWFSIP